MKIRIIAPFFKTGRYEPRFNHSPFFKYLFDVLKVRGARYAWWKYRPIPNKTNPRGHVSAWVMFDDKLVFFDKSDHIQEFDLLALQKCDVYFKDQLNLIECNRVLKKEGLGKFRYKIIPFMSIADVDFYRYLREKEPYRVQKRYDFCHIVGISYHPKELVNKERKKERSGHNYVWIRYHLHNILKNSPLEGYSRLVPKRIQDIDGKIVFPRLSKFEYAKYIMRSNIGIVNTIPHAVWPWKVTEILALGKPFAIDVEPVIELPDIFKLEKNVHYIEIFPGIAKLNLNFNADPYESNSFRAYITEENYRLEILQNHIEVLVKKIRDKEFINHLTTNVEKIVDKVLFNKELLADYIIDKVRKISHLTTN